MTIKHAELYLFFTCAVQTAHLIVRPLLVSIVAIACQVLESRVRGKVLVSDNGEKYLITISYPSSIRSTGGHADLENRVSRRDIWPK
jgi:hypothetical protein